MGLSNETFFLCEKYLKDSFKICELGAQCIFGGNWGRYGERYFKNEFNYLDVTSFDYTGENGAIRVNLSNPIDGQYKNMFDVVTNFGTTEHVKNQYVCWKNIFEILKNDGFVISEIPKKGSWANHRKFYFDEDTFNSLSKDFEVIEFKDIFYKAHGYLIYSVLKKKHDGPFLTNEDEFLSKIEIDKYFDDKQSF